ncbi:hypothetical protein TWF694_007718 [Orbilia ellipsospora]|uniref:Uncharacterized protein n=1 Tax=Orbilia ellipsospora TaxID=2528407 RepID=A0AAV9XK29_9PEZI
MQALSLIILLTSLLTPAFVNGQSLFHGTTVMIQPFKGRHPSNATYETANFYCYFSLEHLQYVSFGWFLGGSPGDLDGSGCHPRPESYGWWEYSTSADCTSDGRECRVHAVNYLVSDTSVPFIDDDYVVLQPFAIGNSNAETLYVSYFDRPGGAHAVGSRRVLEDDACEDAFTTIQEIVKERNVPLGFELTNPCRPKAKKEAFGQKILS